MITFISLSTASRLKRRARRKFDSRMPSENGAPRKILCWKQTRTDASILVGVSAVSFCKAKTVQAGAKVYNGELDIGTITSCSFSPHTD
jgi:hypothetical protein